MSIKILHIIPNLRKGGAERLVLDICNELTLRGEDEVLIITFDEENSYSKVYPDINIKTVPASVSLSISGSNTYQTNELQKEIENFCPDIIHTHLYEAELVSRSCTYEKAKWFSHCHDNMRAFENFSLETLFNKEKFTRFYEKKYLFKRYKKNGGNRFIAISKSTKNYFEKTASPFPIFLLPNAINYSTFFNENKTPSKVLKLVSVGSLVDNKNQTFLIDVAHILSKKNIAFELHLLGDGILRSSLEEKAARLSLGKNIFFHGNVDHVERELWNCDLYVHSAKSEALGLTLIEAMAAGLPVVTLDGKGNRDLIENGKNGYLFFESDAETFADKIMELWTDKESYKSISQYAQNFAKAYDIKYYITNLLHIYKEALNDKR